jgi:hypothetical protein
VRTQFVASEKCDNDFFTAALTARPAPAQRTTTKDSRYHPTKNQVNYYASQVACAQGQAGYDMRSTGKRLDELKSSGDCLDWQQQTGARRCCASRSSFHAVCRGAASAPFLCVLQQQWQRDFMSSIEQSVSFVDATGQTNKYGFVTYSFLFKVLCVCLAHGLMKT